MAEQLKDTKEISLGSGDLFILKATLDTVPEDVLFESMDNLLGEIKGGAVLEYKPTFLTEKSDSGRAVKTIMTEEEAKLKSGLLTWNGNTLKKVCQTARVIDDPVKGKRTVKIGGVANYQDESYFLRFVSFDKTKRVTIKGQNTGGFTFAFAKDKGTVIDAEFVAEAIEKDGTLIIYEEASEKETIVTKQ